MTAKSQTNEAGKHGEKMNESDYLKPKTLDEALSFLEQYGKKAVLIAGGTDVMVKIRQRAISPDVLISLRGVQGLDRIQHDGDLRIGAMVTHRTIEKSQLIRKEFSALADAVDVLGSIQIRNVGTIGGNICTAAPSADTAPPLLVLGTEVKVKSFGGERAIPIKEFFTGPGETVLKEGEIVTELVIPRPLPYTASAYCKHRRRLALDLPIIGVSTLLSLDKDRISCSHMLGTSTPISSILHAMEQDNLVCKEVRIALGVAAPTPMRAVKAETLLRGQKIRNELVDQMAEAAAQEAQPRDSFRAEAWYRRDMIRVFVKRMVVKCIERICQPEEAVSHGAS